MTKIPQFLKPQNAHILLLSIGIGLVATGLLKIKAICQKPTLPRGPINNPGSINNSGMGKETEPKGFLQESKPGGSTKHGNPKAYPLVKDKNPLLDVLGNVDCFETLLKSLDKNSLRALCVSHEYWKIIGGLLIESKRLNTEIESKFTGHTNNFRSSLYNSNWIQERTLEVVLGNKKIIIKIIDDKTIEIENTSQALIPLTDYQSEYMSTPCMPEVPKNVSDLKHPLSRSILGRQKPPNMKKMLVINFQRVKQSPELIRQEDIHGYRVKTIKQTVQVKTPMIFSKLELLFGNAGREGTQSC